MYPKFFPQRLNFKPISPFKTKTNFIIAKIWDRIDRKIALGLPNTIVIEGSGQTGKTTLGRFICMHYDKDYNLLYSVKDAFKVLDDYKERYFSGDKTSMLWKFNLLDEPQLESPSVKFRDERAIALQQIIGAWGELKQNLVLTLPDVGDIGKRFYRNVTYRIQMSVRKNRQTGEREYIAMIYRPYKPIWKLTWTWIKVGRFLVPNVEQDSEYLTRKMDNFFNEKLDRMKGDVKIQNAFTERQLKRGERDPFTPPDVLD